MVQNTILDVTSDLCSQSWPSLLCGSNLRHRHAGTARARESFDSHHLEIEVAIPKFVLCPVIEMIANCNSARSTLALTNGEVLRERARAGDRWLICSRIGADGISAVV